MANLSAPERSELATRAANKRWAKAVPHPPPYAVIKHMLEAIERTGQTHMLFVEGPRTWHCAKDDPANQKPIRSWLADEGDPAIPESKKIRLVGTYGPGGATLNDVMTDVMSVSNT